MKKYLFINQDIDTLKNEIQGKKNPQFKRLLEQSELYMNEKLPNEHPDKSTTYMGMAIANLSLSFLLTKQTKYLTETKRWINTVIHYPHWGNVHLVDVDLSAAWILFGLSLSYDWLKEDFTEDEKTAIKNKLILQAERIYDFKIKTIGHGWSTNFWQNHNWIDHNGLATAGYALKDDYPNSKLWTEDAKNNFNFVFANLAPDGSDYEGVVYWRYGVLWLYVYAHLLQTEEGIDYFKSCDFLKNTFYYRLYQSAPNLEEIINFGDCHDRRSGHTAAIYYKVADVYQNGHAQFLANKVIKDFLYKEQYLSQIKPGILPEAFLELLWYNPEVEEEKISNLPLTKYFSDLGLITIRSSWETDATLLSFKSGHPGGKIQWKKKWELFREKGFQSAGLSHQHPDNNSFILNSRGAFLAIDDGYNRTVKACEHNVVIVDGKGYINEGNNDVFKSLEETDVANIELYNELDGMVSVIGEASKMYQKDLELTRYARHILYTKKDYFIILDELRSSIPHKYSFIMHADTYPIEIEKGVFNYHNGLAQMNLYNISKEDGVHYQDTNVKAIMTTQEPDNYREQKMKSIYIENITPQNNVNFLNVLIPSRFYETSKYQVVTINDINTLGVLVANSHFTDVFLYSETKDIHYKDIVAKATWVLIQYENNTISHYSIHECEYLKVGEFVIHNGEIISKIE